MILCLALLNRLRGATDAEAAVWLLAMVLAAVAGV